MVLTENPRATEDTELKMYHCPIKTGSWFWGSCCL